MTKNNFNLGVIVLVIVSLMTDAVCMASYARYQAESDHLSVQDNQTVLSPLFVEDESERFVQPQLKRHQETTRQTIVTFIHSTGWTIGDQINVLDSQLMILVLSRLRV